MAIIILASVDKLEILVDFVLPVCVLLNGPESIHSRLAVFISNIVEDRFASREPCFYNKQENTDGGKKTSSSLLHVDVSGNIPHHQYCRNKQKQTKLAITGSYLIDNIYKHDKKNTKTINTKHENETFTQRKTRTRRNKGRVFTG